MLVFNCRPVRYTHTAGWSAYTRLGGASPHRHHLRQWGIPSSQCSNLSLTPVLTVRTRVILSDPRWKPGSRSWPRPCSLLGTVEQYIIFDPTWGIYFWQRLHVYIILARIYIRYLIEWTSNYILKWPIIINFNTETDDIFFSYWHNKLTKGKKIKKKTTQQFYWYYDTCKANK